MSPFISLFTSCHYFLFPVYYFIFHLLSPFTSCYNFAPYHFLPPLLHPSLLVTFYFLSPLFLLPCHFLPLLFLLSLSVVPLLPFHSPVTSCPFYFIFHFLSPFTSCYLSSCLPFVLNLHSYIDLTLNDSIMVFLQYIMATPIDQ